ncbi:ArgE/DapE family deacylase [bacterium]|nr:ArgE/DapE family deacylase [bacterium]
MSLTETLLEVVESLRKDAIDLLQELVRIPSITGEETKAQLFFADRLRDLNLKVDCWYPTRNELQNHPSFSDDGLPLGERPIIIGHLAGKDPAARSLILNGHMDVVPVGNEDLWSDGPWSGVFRDGKIYGRGSCDMKGGLVAGLIAITALLKAAYVPKGSVWIQSVIGEESGGAGTLASVIRGYRADAAIVLEPTRMAICPAGAGAATFRIKLQGRAAHGAMRQEGVSAVEKFYVLFSAVQELERSRHLKFQHPLYKEQELVSPISIGKVQAGDWPSTVPESLVAEGRFGILPGENISSARKEFESAIRTAAEKDDWLRNNPPMVEWFEGQFESTHTDLDSAIVKQLKETHSEIHHKEPQIHGVPYGSDLRFFTNDAKMSGVLYGPGDVRVAHSLNEFVPINEVIDVAKTIALMIVRWCE